VNFSDLSSIGAGAGAAAEAGDRTADIALFGPPVDAAAESETDHEEGEFGALLDLLALATQQILTPATPPLPEAAGPTPGTLESVTAKERTAVDATEMFRQLTARTATPEPAPGTEASLAFPALEEVAGTLGQESSAPDQAALGPNGKPATQAADKAHDARKFVQQAIAGAQQSAVADAEQGGDVTPVAQPADVSSTPVAAPAVGTEHTAPVGRAIDVEAAKPVEQSTAVEQVARDASEAPTVPRLTTTHIVHAAPEKPGATEPQAAVAADPVVAAPQATASSGLSGEHGQGDGSPSRGEHAADRGTSRNATGGSHAESAPVVETFSPQLAARIYEAAAAAAAPGTPEAGELADVVPQIVRSIHLQSAGDVGHARVQLRPEHLGEVIVELRVEQGEVIASLEAAVPEVREWIESRAGELKEALGAQGLELMHLSVRDHEESRREQPREHEQPRRQRRQAQNTQAVRFDLPAV
jgi:flagellar hook-length control protein FliK